MTRQRFVVCCVVCIGRMKVVFSDLRSARTLEWNGVTSDRGGPSGNIQDLGIIWDLLTI